MTRLTHIYRTSTSRGLSLAHQHYFSTSTIRPSHKDEIVVKSKVPDVEIPQNINLRDFVLQDSVRNHGSKTAMVNMNNNPIMEC